MSHFGGFKSVFVALVALGCTGCLPAATQEDISRDWNKGVDQWASFDWGGAARSLTGLDLYADGNEPSPEDRTLCLNRNGEDRVMWEDGSSEMVRYRRCAVSPYPTRSVGERLSPGHVNPIE
ncbi:MAG TPA: hypothetical protein VHP58_02730 [Alphaproteobacteria bacterium]|nr:hypothetical protein [Alphaproteobacteria bacterium]